MAATQPRNFLDDDDPPEYTPLPGAQEESLDAGAGAPIVRAQPTHLVLNPSDPRSQYSRSYHASSGSSTVGPRHAVASGPVPVNPRLPSRLNSGYERMEPAPHLTPRARTSLPHMRDPILPPRPTPGSITYSLLRDHPTVVRMLDGRLPPPSSRWHSSNGSCSPQAPAYAAMCPACRNSGWLSYKVPCDCPVGAVVKKNHPRFHSSLLTFIDDLLGPAHYTYPGSGGPGPTSLGQPNTQQHLAYLQHVPGPGSPCPNCMGQSYFRNPDARGSLAARDVRGRLGRTPPPCSVCVDRGRIN